jgi:nucleotide-binding universal stress UspA family protein
MDAPQHLVVGYDGSPLSELALHRALRMTEHAPFGMIHVVSVVQEDGQSVILPTGERLSRWAALDTLRHILDRTTKSWNLRRPQIRVIAHLRAGEPAQTLVDLAYRYHADQILIGVGANRTPSAPIGAVAARVLELSEIPVHLESPGSSSPPSARFNALRWAYVFGGPTLRTDRFGASSHSARPVA